MGELAAMIAKDHPPEIKIFLRLLKSIWEYHGTDSPFSVWNHFIEHDVDYFEHFMYIAELDVEEEEEQLMDEWKSKTSIQSMDISEGVVEEMLYELNRILLQAQSYY